MGGVTDAGPTGPDRDGGDHRDLATTAIRASRRIGYVLASVVTVSLALKMIWDHVRPGMLEQTSTVLLLGILSLMVAPVVTLGAIRRLRSVPQRTAGPAPTDHGAGSEAGARALRHAVHERASSRAPEPARRRERVGEAAASLDSGEIHGHHNVEEVRA